jgi:hypothetical protein
MNRKRTYLAGLTAVAAVASLALVGCEGDRADAPLLGPQTADRPQESLTTGKAVPRFGHVVVANRGSGTISVLNGANGDVVETVDLPGPSPEPMYVVYAPRVPSVLVGDRANSRVVEFDARTFEVKRTVDTGAGVFHMWTDELRNRQLWVNNDIDNTSTVIDPATMTVLETVPMPADLVMAGGKPHDVILDPMGDRAFVTMLVPGDNDYVVQFDTQTFQETARQAVGKDPHVSLTRTNGMLYVPCQNSDIVDVLRRDDLSRVTTLNVPGAHGAGMLQSGQTFYTTNLPGGGTDALFAIDTGTNQVVGDAANSPFPVPHNIAVTQNGRRLFLTHSGGTADKVSFYSISPSDPTPVLLGDVTVGLNPFGLAFVR